MNENENKVSSSEERVHSDLEYINARMDHLQGNVNTSLETVEGHHAMNSSNAENELYSKMNNIVANFNNAQKRLIEKINNEAEVIRQVGEEYYQLDQSLEDEAKEL